LPGFVVDAVVEVPYGAHPTSFFPNYGYDTDLHLAWAKVARDAGDTEEFLERYVIVPSSQAEYLDAVGGASMISRIRDWRTS
jgi:glutaconate CoA-transferase subunit A